MATTTRPAKTRRSAPATAPVPGAGWGEQRFPDLPYTSFHRSGLLIPRQGHDDLAETFSSSVSQRAKASLGRALHLRRPKKNVREVFEKLHLIDLRAPGPPPRDADGRTGMYAAPESMGIASAFLRSQQQVDDLLSEVGDEFEFVPDFPLSLPCRVALDEAPARRSHGSGGVTAEWPADSGIALAHRRGVRGAGVLVAVLDTGVDADHDEFRGRRITHRYVSFFPNHRDWPPRDVRGFDVDGHGTHVSGILCGRTLGVAPEASLHVAGVIESETTLTSITRVVAGLQWVMRQFSRPEHERLPGVLNLSLGFPAELPGVDASRFQQRWRTLQLIIRALAQANILTVAAIGNGGPRDYGYPGAFPEALGVGAVDFGGKLANFSGSGPVREFGGLAKPDVVGYGVDINSAIERDYDGVSIYQRLNGTSMAAPYVAGIAALYRSHYPHDDVAATLDRLRQQALPLKQGTKAVGAGLARYR